jgi:hypothetical protein
MHSVKKRHTVGDLSVLALSPQATAQPGGEGGIIDGRVVEKGKDWVSIKADNGKVDRYLPQRVIGTKDDLDRDVLRALTSARVGDHIEIATRPAAARSPTTRP